MDIVFLAVAGFVGAIVFYDRQLLIKRSSFDVILSISLAFFVAAPVLTIVIRDKPILFPSLMNPLASLGLFLLMRKLFVRWKKREPIDTFHDWRPGLAADRLFNVLYFTLGPFLLFLLYAAAKLSGLSWH
jgi:hypothetical protein